MDFSIYYTKCKPTFLYALLNGPIVKPKIVYNQPLLIFARQLASEKKSTVRKYYMQLLRHVAVQKFEICLFYHLHFYQKVSLYFPIFVGKPSRGTF